MARWPFRIVEVASAAQEFSLSQSKKIQGQIRDKTTAPRLVRLGRITTPL